MKQNLSHQELPRTHHPLPEPKLVPLKNVLVKAAPPISPTQKYQRVSIPTSLGTSSLNQWRCVLSHSFRFVTNSFVLLL